MPRMEDVSADIWNDLLIKRVHQMLEEYIEEVTPPEASVRGFIEWAKVTYFSLDSIVTRHTSSPAEDPNL